MRIDFKRLKHAVVGPPRDPMAPETRHTMALVAFLAWVGLGADGLSSANYGPEEAFLALGQHTHLALYLAAATATTVFVISLAYNQVIELFPSGGGGYKVAKTLIGSRAGLFSGAALIVDYVLTIAISIASGVDALFSFLPVELQPWKLAVETIIALSLLVLNLRGMKESLRILVPLFLGFLLTHGGLIAYGIAAHIQHLPQLIPDTLSESHQLIGQIGWVPFVSIILRAFAMGGGTYTGIEAVSNNVNTLREPRVRTGRWTMLYMATSLAFVAGGLIVLYLLWHATPQEGKTLNAVAFHSILEQIFPGQDHLIGIILVVVLILAAALLFVAANTGFLGGPAVLANMAADDWAPHQFRQLSSRLVTQNGLMLMGGAAIAILFATRGEVSLLVVLYSINVFLTFSLCLFGLCRHWITSLSNPASSVSRRTAIRHLALSIIGFLVSAGILLTTLVEKFVDGAWMTVLITGVVIAAGAAIHRHYAEVTKVLAKVDALFATHATKAPEVPPIEHNAPTAVFLVGRSPGSAMHTLLATQKLFPGRFRNFVFVSVGEIDTESFRAHEALEEMTVQVEDTLNALVNWCHRKGIPSTSYHAFGAETVDELEKLSKQVLKDFPQAVFFATQLMFEPDNWFTRMLHNQTILMVMRRLHRAGVNLIVLPMRI